MSPLHLFELGNAALSAVLNKPGVAAADVMKGASQLLQVHTHTHKHTHTHTHTHTYTVKGASQLLQVSFVVCTHTHTHTITHTVTHTYMRIMQAWRSGCRCNERRTSAATGTHSHTHIHMYSGCPLDVYRDQCAHMPVQALTHTRCVI